MVPAASQSGEAEPSAGRELSEPGTIHKAPGGLESKGPVLRGRPCPQQAPHQALLQAPVCLCL